MVEFSGYWEYSVDDRNRVPVPPIYRDALAVRALLVPGPDRVIEVYTEEGWQERAAPLKRLRLTTPETRRKVRAFFASTAPVQPDSQGRLVLPQRMMTYAGIAGPDRRVVISGRFNCLEIWSREAWDREQGALEDQGYSVLDDLDDLDRLAQEEG
ncbi:MAG: hypothetical protein IT304_12155 [Dehalococcoidia bacterium]|nr:hypothetical protein [Dehalococcoidia bacterium]